MASYGLYTHIQSNKRRSIALIVGLFFLVYVMTYAGALLAEALTGYDAPIELLLRRAWIDLLYAAPWATLGTLLWIAIAYKFHQSLIDAVTGGRDVTRQEQPRLYNLLENLCISRGLTMPTLRVIEDDALNAFATGLNEKQYSITVTSGLLAQLNDAEIESVLGHELTHIRNGDVRMLVIAVGRDHPRAGFSNIVDTHPSVEPRSHAIVEFAGGHDPGPLALPPPDAQEEPQALPADEQSALPAPESEPAVEGSPALPGGP